MIDRRQGYFSTCAVTGGITPCRCIVAANSGEGDARPAWIASMSATSTPIATFLLPSAATWSTTFEPPIAQMLAARSPLNESQRSTSLTAWVTTSFVMKTPVLDAEGGPRQETPIRSGTGVCAVHGGGPRA